MTNYPITEDNPYGVRFPGCVCGHGVPMGEDIPCKGCAELEKQYARRKYDFSDEDLTP